MSANYLHCYFQIIAAIPIFLKQTALQAPIFSENLLSAPNMFHFWTKDDSLLQFKMRCKHYYKLFNEFSVTEPTGIKNW